MFGPTMLGNGTEPTGGGHSGSGVIACVAIATVSACMGLVYCLSEYRKRRLYRDLTSYQRI